MLDRPDSPWRGLVVAASIAFVAATLLAGCAKTATAPPVPASRATTPATTAATAPTASAAATEVPLTPEQNPPGDIPDSQVFVRVDLSGAPVTLKVPEGWGRTDAVSAASFTDKLNTVQVLWSASPATPTAASVKAGDVPSLQKSEAAFQLVSVTPATLPAGAAVLLRYRVNGGPDPVTAKRYRLDVERYILWRSGRRVDLVLSSPVGADNVDPWRVVSGSVTWK